MLLFLNSVTRSLYRLRAGLDDDIFRRALRCFVLINRNRELERILLTERPARVINRRRTLPPALIHGPAMIQSRNQQQQHQQQQPQLQSHQAQQKQQTVTAKKLTHRRKTFALERPDLSEFLAGLQQNYDAQAAPVEPSCSSQNSRSTFFSRGRRPLSQISPAPVKRTEDETSANEVAPAAPASPHDCSDDDEADSMLFFTAENESTSPLHWSEDDEPDAQPFVSEQAEPFSQTVENVQFLHDPPVNGTYLSGKNDFESLQINLIFYFQ